METRALTETQSLRLANFLKASGAEPALAASPTVTDLANHGAVHSELLDALDVRVSMLIGAGATLGELRQLGYSSRHLVKDVGLATQCCRSFGKTEVATAFLSDTEAAICLAGSHAATILGVSPKMLLIAAGGDRAAAEQILDRLFEQDAQHRAALEAGAAGNDFTNPLHNLRARLRCSPLHGVGCEVLARLGIDGLVLRDRYGIGCEDLSRTLGCPVDDLAILGVMSR
jgi:hypothetical protein